MDEKIKILLAEDGFTFEYSATFKQALAGKKTKKKDRGHVRIPLSPN